MIRYGFRKYSGEIGFLWQDGQGFFFHFFANFFAYLMIFQSEACPSPITYVRVHLRKIKCDLFNIYLVSKQFEYGEAFTNMKCKRNIK